MNSIRTIFVIAALLLSINVMAQKAPIKFGKISDEELNMVVYDKDTTAEAVILCDYGDSKYEYNSIQGLQYQFNTNQRIKIFKKEGYKWANFEILIRKNYEKLGGIKAITVNNENGKLIKIKLDNHQIFREDYNKFFEIVKFEMPAVKEGSIIDIEYTITSDLIQFIREWFFQSEIPTMYSEYRVSIPEYFHFKQLEKGYNSIGNKTSSNRTVSYQGTDKTRSEGKVTSTQYDTYTIKFEVTDYIFKSEHVPAFYVEDYITSKENYLSSIQFELGSVKWPNQPVKNYTNTWEAINKELLEDSDFGMQLKGIGFLKDELTIIEALNQTPEAKLEAAYKLIQSRMNWNGRNSIYSFEQSKAWKDGNGTIGDINLLLVAALTKLGLDANPVILSTRKNGFIHPAQIILDQFNYVIAAVQLNEKLILLDASDKFTPVGILPERCLNGQGRLINKTDGKWIDLNPASLSKESYQITISLNTNGEFEGKIKERYEGYAAIKKRSALNYYTTDEDYLTEYEKKNSSYVFTLDSITDKIEITKPIIIEYNIASEEYIEKAGDLLLLNPMILAQITKNPFKLENREYPVDFSFPQSIIYVATIKIPEGYAIENLPEIKKIALPERSATFTLSAQQSANSIVIVSRFDINKITFLPDEYLNLKEFYNQVIDAQSKQVILKKI
jgi:hypothetical protein